MENKDVTVVVITKDEEKNIRDCMESIHGWANEIIVVDSESTDKTLDIVKEYTNRVFIRKMVNEGRHRNWSYSQARNKWILSLDADERVTDELKAEINKTIPSTEFFAFDIPRRNYIGEYWVKNGGQYPAAQVRLFLKGQLVYEEVGVHPRVLTDVPTGVMKGDIVHKSYKNFSHFLRKLDTHTTLEAQKWIETNRKMKLGKALWRTFDRFMRSFFRKKGYRDGFVGFMFSYFASLYQIISYAKYWEMKQAQEASDGEKKQ